MHLLRCAPAAVTCSGLPDASLTPNHSGWDPSCFNATAGRSCFAACAANATGPGYSALCEINSSSAGNSSAAVLAGVWNVTGSCTGDDTRIMLYHLTEQRMLGLPIHTPVM